MSGIDPDERPQPGPRAPWAPDEEPEPAWADAIRRGRKARGDRLREVFDSFGDEESVALGPTSPTNDEVDVS